MIDSSLQASIDALPTYIDRAILAEMLPRLEATHEQQLDLLRGLTEQLPAELPGKSGDFALSFDMEGNEEVTALFNQLIKWP